MILTNFQLISNEEGTLIYSLTMKRVYLFGLLQRVYNFEHRLRAGLKEVNENYWKTLITNKSKIS